MGAFMRKYGDTVLPMVEQLMPQIAPMLDKGRNAEERRIAVCIIDDLLEHCPAGLQRYLPNVMPVLLEVGAAPPSCGRGVARLQQPHPPPACARPGMPPATTHCPAAIRSAPHLALARPHAHARHPPLQACGDRHEDLRQCSAYGVGVVAEKAPAAFKPYLATALAKLSAIINAPDARNEDNE
jgi:hypothetical protein